MKKNDIVYIYDGKIKRTVIESIRNSVVDGKKQPTEYLIRRGFAQMEVWVEADELYDTPEAVVTKLKADAIKEVEETYQDFDTDLYDTRYKGGVVPDETPTTSGGDKT